MFKNLKQFDEFHINEARNHYVLIDTILINGKNWTAWRAVGSKAEYFLAPSTVDPNSTFEDEKVINFEKRYKVGTAVLFDMDII